MLKSAGVPDSSLEVDLLSALTRSHRRALAPLVVVLLLSACAPAQAPAPAGSSDAAAAAPPYARPAILDGQEKSLVVVGYSTSYVWPQLLQDMLDEHAGGRTYHILNAVIGGSPVGRWIAGPDSDDYHDTYGAMLRDFFGADPRLRGAAPPPTVAIVQQSLQRTPTPETRLGPVTAAGDREGIEIGTEALATLVEQLRSDGVEHVFIAMHIYKEGYEPEVGNERFALDALLRRGLPYAHAGPDVWSLTIREHPQAFTEDRLHPNERGSKLMAEAWYRSLAGDAARQELIDAMHAREIDDEAMMRAYLEWRREESGSP